VVRASLEVRIYEMGCRHFRAIAYPSLRAENACRQGKHLRGVAVNPRQTPPTLTHFASGRLISAALWSPARPTSRYYKETGKTYLRPDDSKCLHYYFYFIDEELGLTYVCVPTWFPCRLQIYFNGHDWLAGQLRKREIDYRLMDNAFVEIGDWGQAQGIADGW
jgi:hypothetical protein